MTSEDRDPALGKPDAIASPVEQQVEVVDYVSAAPEVGDQAAASASGEVALTETDADDERSFGLPEGALAFGFLIVIGYAIYFFYIWFVVAIERGG